MEIKEATYYAVCIYSLVTCSILFYLLYETHHDISQASPSSSRRFTIDGVLKVVNNNSSSADLNYLHNEDKIEEDEYDEEDEDDAVIPDEWGGDAAIPQAGGVGGEIVSGLPDEIDVGDFDSSEEGEEGEGVILDERDVDFDAIPHKEGVGVRAKGVEMRALPLAQANGSVTGYFIMDSNQPFRKRCRRCALVSSGGHLYRSGAGAEIDSAECVLRMNTAPVIGWSSDVGIRTDIRIIGHVNFPRGLVKRASVRNEVLSNSTTRTRYIVVPWLRQDKRSMKTKIVKIARQFKHRYPGVDYVFLTSKKHSESEVRYKKETGYSRAAMRTSFSTGFVSMMFALDICEEVLVYGMSSDDFCKKNLNSKVPYHYYEPRKKGECFYTNKMEMNPHKGHKFLTEHAMFARWSTVRNITFHYPSWRPSKQSKRVGSHFVKTYKETLKSKNEKG